MLSLFPATKIITTVAAIYALLIIVFISISPAYTAPDVDLFDRTFFAIRMAGLLDMLLIAMFFSVWRRLWHRFPVLNSLVFPDLNGEWEAIIDWRWLERRGSKIGFAKIRQDLTNISIELYTDESESESLSVKPKKDPESGRPHLFYFYRNTPKHNGSNKDDWHEGAVILRVDPKNINLLEGNYFTSRSTGGRLMLSRNEHKNI